MVWTARAYFDLVKDKRVWLRGWPRTLPFGNFSRVPRSQMVVRELRRLWDRGDLAWEHIPEGQMMTLDVTSAVPSWTLAAAPRRSRSDIGSTHQRQASQPLYPRAGAKTPAIVDSALDSDIEESSEEGERAEKAVPVLLRKRAAFKSAEYVEDSEAEDQGAESDPIELYSDDQ